MINIHSHSLCENSIYNILLSKDLTSNHYGKVSAGYHPWYLEQTNKNDRLNKYDRVSKMSNLIFIGETGLDKKCSTPFTLQEEVFIEHIQLAIDLKKPLIIHCVRAYQEILHILKMQNFNSPIIFHDYNGSPQLTKKIIKQGHIYFSFGKNLFDPLSQARKSLISIPHRRIFLETDAHDYSIQNVYSKMSELKNITLLELTSIINQNFCTLLKL